MQQHATSWRRHNVFVITCTSKLCVISSVNSPIIFFRSAQLTPLKLKEIIEHATETDCP